jgi:hypothetical protein
VVLKNCGFVFLKPIIEKYAINKIIVRGRNNFADLVTNTLLTPSGSTSEMEKKYNDNTPIGIRMWDKKKLAVNTCLKMGLTNFPIFTNIHSLFL